MQYTEHIAWLEKEKKKSFNKSTLSVLIDGKIDTYEKVIKELTIIIDNS